MNNIHAACFHATHHVCHQGILDGSGFLLLIGFVAVVLFVWLPLRWGRG